ncbi:MAG: thiolase family protein [Deltaproteobacteria bacterium]|nr:thiolase family protein [Deltaproteobacteria bacterium]MBW2381984.1 thiolase family protein [Deltaproteobacteria bacterium]MBW2696579.1 thiolase family protein [Deltaproteobacteria bacterium]
MGRTLADMRAVSVVGIGLHRYQKSSKTPYVELGLSAVREALADAEIEWSTVESAFVGNAVLGMAPGRAMLKHLGATGLTLCQVENASASGSTAIRHACLEVATGISDVSIAIGVDKPGTVPISMSWTGAERLSSMSPLLSFALLTNEYMNRYGATPEQIAAVAVKNHGNAASNPYAQFQKVRSLDEVLEHPVAGSLTRLQCCPFGEGAAAVILASDEGIERLGIAAGRAVEVIGSVSRSERVYTPGDSVIVELTRETATQAFDEAGVGPADLDVVEVHDAFSVEELLYTEALGLCAEGEGARYLAEGRSQIGGDCAVSASGGLIAMGHPFGPTGVGQVVEIARQLRGEAGVRQHAGARVGLAHMVGLGQVCLVHILRARI